jgi:hypothetical protein
MPQTDLEFPANLDQDFLIEVENLVQYANLTYLDAVIHFCTKRSIEVEMVVPLISRNVALKSKLQENAEKLHFLKRTRKLPID